ncbi:MAG: TonB-dependent receptor plug domain-containing protein [Pseudomonadota bacterium]
MNKLETRGFKFSFGIILFAVCFLTSAVVAKEFVELEEIVVTGEKIEDYVKKNPSQVVGMDAGQIEQRNFLQVYDVLGSMAGVDVKPASNGLGTRISIRGGGGSGSVLVLIDGRPASTMQYGGVDLGSIPIDIIKKIIVFKPPVPVWLGPGSSAGAIYIETKTNQTGKTAKKNGKIRISAGSFGQANLSGSLNMNADDHDVMLSAGTAHMEGKRTNSQKDQGNISLHYGKKADGIDFQVNAGGFVSDHGVPDLITPMTFITLPVVMQA